MFESEFFGILQHDAAQQARLIQTDLDDAQ